MGRGVEGEYDAKERAMEAGDNGGRDSASAGLFPEHIPQHTCAFTEGFQTIPILHLLFLEVQRLRTGVSKVTQPAGTAVAASASANRSSQVCPALGGNLGAPCPLCTVPQSWRWGSHLSKNTGVSIPLLSSPVPAPNPISVVHLLKSSP